ncbi:NADH:ubiquinone reductase (H(+)-translocating)/NADH dehydrogenase [Trypanosoma cruzi]|nr:NADH:ubiquinone reductase (H(+)-translocating)/NADH dehydrogenase [Trypanosoma cruzi]
MGVLLPAPLRFPQPARFSNCLSTHYFLAAAGAAGGSGFASRSLQYGIGGSFRKIEVRPPAGSAHLRSERWVPTLNGRPSRKFSMSCLTASHVKSSTKSYENLVDGCNRSQQAWGIDAGTKTFHLPKCDETVLRRAMHLHIQVSLRALDKFVAAAQHTRGCHAKLDVILPHWLAIKHGVERHGLKDLHWGHLTNTGNFVHCCHRDISALLPLRKMQEGNHGTSSAAPWEFRENSIIDFLIACYGEVPRYAGVVRVCVLVPHLAVNKTAGSPL